MLEERILKMVRSRKNGVLQKEITKKLRIESKKCSTILKQMEDRGLIKRTAERVEGTSTFRISPVRKQKYTALLAGGTIAPCIGCTSECVPENCEPVGEWIQNLVKSNLESRTK